MPVKGKGKERGKRMRRGMGKGTGVDSRCRGGRDTDKQAGKGFIGLRFEDGGSKGYRGFRCQGYFKDLKLRV